MLLYGNIELQGRWNEMIYLELIDLKTLKIFKKEFQTEWERDKFANKLKYSKKIKVIGRGI